MRLAASLILCFFLLLIPAAAFAQTPVIDTMQISLWPEYDRPDVLVIYQFTLSQDVSLPVKITMHIPAASGEPFNLAYSGQNENGETALFNLDFETALQGKWIEVSFMAPARSIQLEYYDPDLLRTGDSRDFVFTWAGDYEVLSMTVQIRQPVNVSKMQIDPDKNTTGMSEDGQFYYKSQIGPVEAGHPFSVRIQYDKPDDILASGYDQIFATDGGIITRQSTFQNALPWILGSLGILMITVAVVWYLIPNQEGSSLWKRLSKPRIEKLQENVPMYCHNCGARRNEEDLFCRACGTRLRK